MKKYTSEQRGRSMIEMLGVLAIVGVLSVAGIAGYSKAMAKYKTNKLIDQVSTVAANIRTTFAAQGNYKGLTSDTAYSLGIYPEEVAKECDLTNNTDSTESCLKNAFGGQLVVFTDANDDIDGNTSFFDVAVDHLSKDACTALVMADWGPASSVVGLMKTTSNSGEAYDVVGEDRELYSLSELRNSSTTIAAEVCDCGSENKCVVNWRFN